MLRPLIRERVTLPQLSCPLPPHLSLSYHPSWLAYYRYNKIKLSRGSTDAKPKQYEESLIQSDIRIIWIIRPITNSWSSTVWGLKNEYETKWVNIFQYCLKAFYLNHNFLPIKGEKRRERPCHLYLPAKCTHTCVNCSYKVQTRLELMTTSP